MNDRKPDDYSADSRRLLGLDTQWRAFSEGELRNILKSAQRIAAYQAIWTSTLPKGPKSNEKQGIVSHILRNELLSEEILRQYPTVYLGAGDDIEYPLALGARHSFLVDPILNEQQVKDSINTRLTDLIGGPVALDGNAFEFMFDFGSGKESTTIELVPRYYAPPKDRSSQMKPQNIYTNFPPNIGLILLYASRSPWGDVQPQSDIRSRLVKKGAILNDRRFVQKGPLGMRKPIDVATLK